MGLDPFQTSQNFGPKFSELGGLSSEDGPGVHLEIWIWSSGARLEVLMILPKPTHQKAAPMYVEGQGKRNHQTTTGDFFCQHDVVFSGKKK